MGARLSEMLANPSDAIFSLGIVESTVFQNCARIMWAAHQRAATRPNTNEVDSGA